MPTTASPHGFEEKTFRSLLVRETSLLALLAEDEDSSSNEQAVVCIRTLDESRHVQRALLSRLYSRLFRDQFGLNVSNAEEKREEPRSRTHLMFVAGRHALRFAKVEEGMHLFCSAHENLIPIEVSVVGVERGENATSAFERGELGLVTETTASTDLATIRVYEEQGVTLDLRSELMTLRMPTVQELRAFVLSMLPLPDALIGDD